LKEKKQWSGKKKSELIAQLEEFDAKISSLKNELSDAKNKETIYESELRSLQNEIKYMEANKKSIDILSENIKSSETTIKDLENNLKDLESKLTQKEKKIEELLLDKESLLKEKSEILESKNSILQQIKDKELEIQQKDQKISELREKYKQSSGDLLSKSMQIDKLVKKDKNFNELEDNLKNLENQLEQKEQTHQEKMEEYEKIIKDLKSEIKMREDHETGEIKVLKNNLERYEKKIEELEKDSMIEKESIENTQLFSNLEDIIKIIKDLLPQGKSNIRLILPEIENLSDFELIDIIKEIPNKVRINISTGIDDPLSNLTVKDMKNYCQLTNYAEKKFIALNIDSSKFLIALFIGEDKIIGLYTEVLKLIELFKPAIMEPFIRGSKII